MTAASTAWRPSDALLPVRRAAVRPRARAEPWQRGVIAEHLVLACPACQRQAGQADAFTTCAGCGSRHLIRRLDQVECLDCRLSRDAAPDPPAPDTPVPDGPAPDAPAPGGTALADEVARALGRVLRRE